MRQISQGAQLEPLGRSSLPENDFDIFDLHKLIFRIIFRIIQISNIVSLLFFWGGWLHLVHFPQNISSTTLQILTTEIDWKNQLVTVKSVKLSHA